LPSLLVATLCGTLACGGAQLRPHPRIFAPGVDFNAVRRNIETVPAVKEAWDKVRSFAYSNRRQTNLWVTPSELQAILVAYYVENKDRKLLARARGHIQFLLRAEGDEWTDPLIMQALCMAFDWLYDELSAQEKQAIATRVAELVRRVYSRYRHSDYNNHVYLQYGPLLFVGLAFAGEGLIDDVAQKCLAEGEDLLKNHFIKTINQVGGEDGGWHESMGYHAFFMWQFVHCLEAWRTATGEDLFPQCTGLRGDARWILYCLRPHDGSRVAIADINTPAPLGANHGYYLPITAARYRDGVAQYLVQQVPRRFGSRAWPIVLFYDSSLPVADIAKLPTARVFRGLGWAAMRSDWTKDAAFAVFVCGDYYAGHQHMDQNSFVIHRRGTLAIDAGEYGCKGTEYHNTLLIGGPQRPWGNDPRRFYAPIAPGSKQDTGDLVAYRHHPPYTYVCGQAAQAYPQGKVKSFTRQFVFIRPALFVVFDRAVCGAQPLEMKWLLHSREPSVGEREVVIRNGKGVLRCIPLLPRELALRRYPQRGKKRTDQCTEWGAPPAAARNFLFLLVADERKPQAQVAEQGQAVVLSLRWGELSAELRFATAGPPAGHIAVASQGKTLVDEDLPASVEAGPR